MLDDWNIEVHLAMVFGDICENSDKKAEFAAARAQLRRALEMMYNTDEAAAELRAGNPISEEQEAKLLFTHIQIAAWISIQTCFTKWTDAL